MPGWRSPRARAELACRRGHDLFLRCFRACVLRRQTALAHARSALAVSERLGLAQVRAVVLLFLGEIHAMRRERAEMERFLALASSAGPGDPEIEGSAWAGARGMLALLDDD